MGRMSKDKRDIYYRKAKEEGFRARSAFKLMQIDDQFEIISGCKRIVDLCAAPGSWSQVLAKRVSDACKRESIQDRHDIVAVDLQEMAPIPGVTCLKGDITCEKTAQAVLDCFPGDDKADLVVCDGAPDVTGMHDLDEFIQSQLVLAALAISTCLLRTDGAFVAKVFRGEHSGMLYAKLGVFFDKVHIAKPKSSRNSSSEAFVVCQGFKVPRDYGLPSIRVFSHYMEKRDVHFTDKGKNCMVPFVCCGDLRGYDADMNYRLCENYEYLEPVQKPIHAPYEQALRNTSKQHQVEL